jgi:hypothetical protein
MRRLGILAAFLVLLLPSVTFAQSSIAGVVRDDTGGVLPGVTVEAASPALIEKTRSVVSDDQGQYKIVDLRPGEYSVTFTLQGFNTFKRDGITLQANTVATVNGEMKVGSLQETITVTGEAPLVDVQSSVNQQIVNRDLLDKLPTGRQMWGVGATLPGIVVSGQDVGGSGGVQQTKISAHGADVNQTVTQVDGMELNTMVAAGSAVPYFNDGMSQEMTFQTSALGAETSAGGVRVNMIPKEGGNVFHGDTFFGSIPNSSFSSKNLHVGDPIYKAGLTSQPTVLVLKDFNQSLGGPIAKDRLWFFSSYRYLQGNNTVAGAFYANGSPAIDDNSLKQGLVRLTYRASANHKISYYYDLTKKFRGHDSLAAGVDENASTMRPPRHYSNLQVKWTGTISSKMLIETGYSRNVNKYDVVYRPGVAQDRGTPAWYAMASRTDTLLSTRHVAGAPEQFNLPIRNTITSSLSYVTGSHAYKVGMQWGYGFLYQGRDANADLTQVYLNGAPSSVTVYNTPLQSRGQMPADLGIYAQDAWTMKRLTLNYGLRWEYFDTYIAAQDAPAGRFVPARHFDAIHPPTFKDVTPRFGAAYDLFGDGKTAVKASVSKYVSQQTTDFANNYNPLFFASDSRTWNDLNKDDIAQDNEIGPSNNSSFGILQSRKPDPHIKREYNIEYTAVLQRQLTKGISASIGYYRRGFHRLQVQDNLLIDPSNFAPVTIANPIDGSPLTVYNMDRAKQGQVSILDTNNIGNKKQVYNGLELSSQARVGQGRMIFGWTHDRTVYKNCSLDDPNNPDAINGGAGGRFCDQSSLGIPFRNQFKLSGAYPIVWGIQFSGVLTSYPGRQAFENYTVTRTIIPTLTQTSVTVPLITPGSKFLDQWNQLDLGFAKVVTFSNTRNVRLQVDLFNSLNANTILNENFTYGPALFRPTEILQGRVIRLGAQFHF